MTSTIFTLSKSKLGHKLLTASSAAFIEAIFFGTQLARRGGPVRRKQSTIEKYTTIEAVTAACKRRNWRIIKIGEDWLMFDGKLPVDLILLPFTATLSLAAAA